jgi:hypothetical protein
VRKSEHLPSPALLKAGLLLYHTIITESGEPVRVHSGGFSGKGVAPEKGLEKG